MKFTLAAVGIVIVGAIAYFLYMQNTSAAPSDAPENNTASAGKLNINVVCEGALAYMSFPDGASAEKFVAECKAGEHPEVIEKYKQDNGFGDGAAI